MQKYQKIPVTVRAIRTGDVIKAIQEGHTNDLPPEILVPLRKGELGVGVSMEDITIPTTSGLLVAGLDDMIIHSEEGVLYPCAISVFEERYRPAIGGNKPVTAKELVLEVAPKVIEAWDRDNVVPLDNGAVPTPASVIAKLQEYEPDIEYVVAFAQLTERRCKTLHSNASNAELAYCLQALSWDVNQIMFGEDIVEDT